MFALFHVSVQLAGHSGSKKAGERRVENGRGTFGRLLKRKLALGYSWRGWPSKNGQRGLLNRMACSLVMSSFAEKGCWKIYTDGKLREGKPILSA